MSLIVFSIRRMQNEVPSKSRNQSNSLSRLRQLAIDAMTLSPSKETHSISQMLIIMTKRVSARPLMSIKFHKSLMYSSFFSQVINCLYSIHTEQHTSRTAPGPTNLSIIALADKLSDDSLSSAYSGDNAVWKQNMVKATKIMQGTNCFLMMVSYVSFQKRLRRTAVNLEEQKLVGIAVRIVAKAMKFLRPSKNQRKSNSSTMTSVFTKLPSLLLSLTSL